MRHRRLATDTKALGQNIRHFRREKQMSQMDLCLAINKLWAERYPGDRSVSIDWLRDLERGTHNSVTADRAVVLAEVLDIPLSSLLPVEDLKVPPTTAADLAVALRGYGLSGEGVKQAMAYLEYLKQANAEPEQHHSNGAVHEFHQSGSRGRTRSTPK